MSAVTPERLWPYVEPTGFCWNWIGTRTQHGYGEYRGTGGAPRMQAHRAAYIVLVGEIDPRAVLDHLCRNRACVNPDHLVPTTVRQNVIAGFGPTAINARKTRCVNGHEFTVANTYREGSRRRCRACGAMKARRYRERKTV